MFVHILSRLRHRPLPAVAVILFSTIISFVICSMQASNDSEAASFEETYNAVAVPFVVTDLYGDTEATWLEGWFGDIFLGRVQIEPLLSKYVKDLQMETDTYISGDYSKYRLAGITSYLAADVLNPGKGAKVTYFEGYDETIFETDELYCIVPMDLYEYERSDPESNKLELTFTVADWTKPLDLTAKNLEIVKQFTIVGTYDSLKERNAIYCPYEIADSFNRQKDSNFRKVSFIRGTLNDNIRLEEFKTAAAYWFAEPNSEGRPTPWDKLGYEYFPYAIDIDDRLLKQVVRSYEISIFINEMSAVLVLAFSTIAGFAIGFLMIRSRKREINLMRTLGGSNGGIYLDFCLEQMVCIVLGTLVGGAMFGFNAPQKLLMFDAVYFVGLTTALLIFLNKNLLTSIKEDE